MLKNFDFEEEEIKTGFYAKTCNLNKKDSFLYSLQETNVPIQL